MTGLSLGKAVQTDAAWARQVEQRLGLLENPTQQRVGSFVFTDNNSGNLVVHSPNMTPTVLAGAEGFATLLQQATAAAAGTASSTTTTVDSSTGLTIGGVVSMIQGLLQNGVTLAEDVGETGLQDFLNLLAGALDLTGEIEYTAAEVATGLEGFLTNLSATGVLALAGLATGALPSGITLAVGGLTGLATGIETWLASGGSLPSGVSLAIGDITGLATGIESWLAGGGALPSGVSLGVASLTGLATGIETWLAAGGALPSGVSLAVSEVTGLASGIESWLAAGGALPSGVTLAVADVLDGGGHALTGYLTNLTNAGNWTGALSTLGSTIGGYFTNINSSGVVALAGLASGALPGGVTLAVSGLTGLASGVGTWLASGGGLPSATTLAVGSITGLATGIEAWLASGGALPSGVSLGVSAVTGFATGIESWLAGGGALPSGVSLGVSAVTGLATGIETWLAGGGGLPSATTLAVSGLTGLATGIESWLASSGSLPGAVTLAGSQLTGTVNNTIVSSALGLSSLGADVESYMATLGSMLPKTLPWTIGTSTNTTLANPVPLSSFQQLLDGIVNNGTANNTPAAAVAALQNQFAGAKNYVSQAILDGVNSSNSNTGVAQALQVFPNVNVTSVVQGGENLGSDVLSAFSGFFNLLGGSPLVGSSVQAVNAMGLTGAGEYVAALNEHIAGSGSGSSGVDINVDFASYPNSSTLPPIFTGGAGIGISGGSTDWTGGVSASLANSTTVTNTDYQVVELVFSALNNNANGQYGANRLYGRSNAANTTMVEAYFYFGNVYLVAHVAGTQVWTTHIAYTPIVGATYQLELGNPETSTILEFNLYCNGVPVLSYIDSALLSQYGPSYRESGFGEGSALGTAQPAYLQSWGVYDNPPAAAVGSFFRQYRASATQVDLSPGGGVSLIPSNYFDTNQICTSDITSNPGNNNEVIVSVAAQYAVKIGIYTLSSGSGQWICPVLYKNGTTVEVGGMMSPSGNVVSADTFFVDCVAGDILQPGFYSSYTGAGGFATQGEATGTYCYWSVTFANCGTIS